ncbi:PREDICTED: dirigent protein 21-like [Camelina sativa]|uniref:Dirigent protein n=1 Tax=Camelina sativa TaxID=90675 RepID=A0ABM0YRA7_CAMSA|nr:PREDICTED: dirigent protein 21-like [Camelina sativa]XP_010504754.1 PREDICTED: dirigent protein 21-like [Camelina sativa]
MASLLLSLFSTLLLAATITECEAYSKTVKAPYPGPKPEKLTHLHFYFHVIDSGNKPTDVLVATGPTTNSSATNFGLVAIDDDPLTMGPDITSDEIGRAQGMYASTDQNKFGLLMAFNFVFTKGEFSGSTISMYGRNAILSKVREMPIIGGTGAFRFGRGYAQAKTFVYNTTSGNAVVVYNVYVWH